MALWQHLVRLLGSSLVVLASGLIAAPGAGAASAVHPQVGDSRLLATWTGYESGRFLDGVAAADFNGDGKPDVAWARDDFFQNQMDVQLNLGDGTLGSAVGYPASLSSRDITVGDLDRDGDLDLVVASQGTTLANSTIDLYFNNGHGTFTRRTATGGSGPTHLVLADLNGDGAPDLALSNYWTGADVSVLLNTGTGTFGPQTRYPVGDRPSGIVAADLDGDGDLELAVARYDSGRNRAIVEVLVNNGAGRFVRAPQPIVTVNSGQDPVLATADFNADGRADLAVGGTNTDQQTVLLNRGNRTFSQQSYPAGVSAASLRALDVNGDGVPDLVSAASGVTMLLNRGDGTFGAAATIQSGYLPIDATAADFNGDGRPDLAVANRGTNTGAIYPQLRNGSFARPPLYPNSLGLTLGLASADFDRDGNVDVAESSETIQIMHNQGNGMLTPGQVLPSGGPSGTLVRSVFASDLNGDGAPDLVWVPDVQPYPYVYALNLGDGSFGPITVVNLQTCGTGQVTTADVDNDGDQDVLVANNRGGPTAFCDQVSRTIRIALNNGDGTFQPDYGVEVFPLPEQAIGADVNGDGKTDLISTSAMTSVALGLGGGTFAPRTDYNARGREVAAGNFNGDGALDLATTDSSTNTSYVLLNTGGGMFSSITTYPGEEISGFANSFSLVLGDLDGDGILDLILANAVGNNVGVHFGHGDGTFETQQIRYGADSGLLDLVAADFNRDGRLDLAATATTGTGFSGAVQTLLNVRRTAGR